MDIPPPPKFKPTIIAMKGSGGDYELLLLVPDGLPPLVAGTKRRRRTLALALLLEMDRRRAENKAAHSIIEKKRRIRMNREFEALKYLVPACRDLSLPLALALVQGLVPLLPLGKIDGMHKLTILQALVEYIKYLHMVVQRQHALLQELDKTWAGFDIGFTAFNLNINEYRNIDQEFAFHELHRALPSPMMPPSGRLSTTLAVLPHSKPNANDVSLAPFALPEAMQLYDLAKGTGSKDGKAPKLTVLDSPMYTRGHTPDADTGAEALLMLRKTLIQSLLN